MFFVGGEGCDKKVTSRKNLARQELTHERHEDKKRESNKKIPGVYVK